MNLHHPSTDLTRRGQRVVLTAVHLKNQTLTVSKALCTSQHQPTFWLHSNQGPNHRSTLLAPAPMHERTVINSLEPASGQTPRKTKLKLALNVHSITIQAIEIASIGIRYRRHIGGILEATFDFETTDSELHQIRQERPSGEILWRQ